MPTRPRWRVAVGRWHSPVMARLRSQVAFHAGIVAAIAIGTVPALPAERRGEGFALAYAAGARDAGGRFMGGTGARTLVAYRGRLYAGIGYWEDRRGGEGRQGAAILVLDGPAAAWRVEHVFDETLPPGTVGGRKRDFAISALLGVNFATDGSGAPLPVPVSLLLASSWDLTGATRIFSRDEATGAWSATTLAADRPAPDFLPQIRSLAAHRDRSTGGDRVFAGNDPRGIFAGSHDPPLPGGIRWDPVPELDISAISTAGFRGLAGPLGVSGFRECDGGLHAAVGQRIYRREDGAAPRWRLVYTNPDPGHSETGLRGLTAIANPSGAGRGSSKEVLLAAVEGDAARIVRVDPASGAETTELDLRAFLADAWGERVGYVIAAYNDMTKSGDLLLIGVHAFIPLRAPIAPGHAVVDVGYGRVESGGWYLVRHADGRYALRRIALPAPDDGRAPVAVRTIAAPPFPAAAGAFYFARYDANKAPAHDTAWIARAGAKAALGDRQ